MRLSLRLLAGTVVVLGLGACDPPSGQSGGQTDGKTELSALERGIPPIPDDISPATMIAFSGHGNVYDHALKKIELSDKLVIEMQDDMTRLLLQDGQERLNKDVLQTVLEARKLALSGELQAADTLILQGALNSALLRSASERLTARLDWRHRLLVRRSRPYFVTRNWREILIPRYARLVELLRPWILVPRDTDYVKRCEAEDVPVPPVWSQANFGQWKSHGALTTKLIDQGFSADVYTWADPHKRGGCILLPRGSGVAGIICQSASTGAACFWDNIRLTNGSRIDWQTETLNVNQMEDGDLLASNCTGCHRGNNVFNISPDDATWAKVIRPTNRAVTPGNTYTTNVEGVARYTPISTQPTWSNPPPSSTGGFCSGCHEVATVGFSAPTMPPACATSTTDASACYN